MPILYHSPMTRSSGIRTLIREMGVDVDIRTVSVVRNDGSGAPDPANPHPEKKVPYLVDGDEQLRERAAIMLYLTDMYPKGGMGPAVGAPGRGAYLSWLAYYQGVMEPVIILKVAGIESPIVQSTLRDFDAMVQRLEETLSRGPWLLGDSYSAVDILCSSPFEWLPDLVPSAPVIQDWLTRCAERPATQAQQAEDAAEWANLAS